MSMQRLHLIVEGHGDKDAIPKLVHKVWQAHGCVAQIDGIQVRGDVNSVRIRLNDILNYALKRQCPVLVVLDADDKKHGNSKTPGELGCPIKHSEFFRNAIAGLQLHKPQPIEFAFFNKEFESLFLAEQQALKSFYGLATIDINVTQRAAKEAIGKQQPKGKTYKEIPDQAKITSLLDLTICRQVSRDFRHFESALLKLCPPTV